MRILHLAAVVALIFGAMPASAAVTFTMTGVVTSGTDNGNSYLPNGGSAFGIDPYAVDLGTGATYGMATGRAFSLVITLDETLGVLSEDATAFQRYGEGVDSPITAAFTMNGVTQTLGNYVGNFAKSYQNPDRLVGRAEEERNRPDAAGPFTTFYGYLAMDMYLPANVFAEKGFAEAASWSRSGNENALGRLSMVLQDTNGTGEGPIVLLPQRVTDLYLRFDTLNVTSGAAAAPEPATWAMMIMGFGLAGAAVRRRRALARLG
jgi:hypothetical protein